LQFVNEYGAKVYGLDQHMGGLDLIRLERDGVFHHFRYSQRHAGYKVLNGQLTLHVVRVRGGFAVKTANGWVFPDIEGGFSPSLDSRRAEAAALGGLTQATALGLLDSGAVIVADRGRYRLTYRVSVSDPLLDRIVTRYVDAETGQLYAETQDGASFTPRGVESHHPRNARERAADSLVHVSGSSSHRSMGSYVSVSAVDWDNAGQTFFVWDTGSIEEVRDNSHTGASEIRIRDHATNPYATVCVNSSIVTHSLSAWGSTNQEREVVSAVHHAGATIDYFHSKFSWDNMRDNGAALEACVNTGSNKIGGRYDHPANVPQLWFSADTNGDAPGAAAQDIVTHEFTHGVSHYMAGWAAGDSTINEGLSDYFAARHRGTRCMAGGYSASPTCLRYLKLDSMAIAGLCYSYANSSNCLSIRLSSALLDATEASSGYYADEVDFDVYTGLLNYIAANMEMAEGAFWIVKYARDHAHQPAFTGLREAGPTLQNQSYTHGLGFGGYAPVLTKSRTDYTYWSKWKLYLSEPGEGNVTFEIGSQGLNLDGSVTYPDSEVDLGNRIF
jgi:hypothetical protein